MPSAIDKAEGFVYNISDDKGTLISLVWLTLEGHVRKNGAYPKLCGSLLLESIVCISTYYCRYRVGRPERL